MNWPKRFLLIRHCQKYSEKLQTVYSVKQFTLKRRKKVMKKLNKEQASLILKKMKDIRNFEAEAKRLFAAGEIPGFVHLYAGEEAIASGVCAHLTDDDQITSTHRGHGHCIAKGCDLDGMMAEILGKETGLCKGKGGSMHIAD